MLVSQSVAADLSVYIYVCLMFIYASFVWKKMIFLALYNDALCLLLLIPLRLLKLLLLYAR